MKKLLLPLMILLTSPMFLLAANVTFVMENLESDQGSVRAGVYKDEAGFLKNAIASCASKGVLVHKQARVICQLKPGTYVVALYHDENDNKKLDTNFMHIPKEGYGFSNNAKGSFGPPEFKDAAFTVGEEDMEMNIRLTY